MFQYTVIDHCLRAKEAALHPSYTGRGDLRSPVAAQSKRSGPICLPQIRGATLMATGERRSPLPSLNREQQAPLEALHKSVPTRRSTRCLICLSQQLLHLLSPWETGHGAGVGAGYRSGGAGKAEDLA